VFRSAKPSRHSGLFLDLIERRSQLRTRIDCLSDRSDRCVQLYATAYKLESLSAMVDDARARAPWRTLLATPMRPFESTLRICGHLRNASKKLRNATNAPLDLPRENGQFMAFNRFQKERIFKNLAAAHNVFVKQVRIHKYLFKINKQIA
jgi:hypothetical protein